MKANKQFSYSALAGLAVAIVLGGLVLWPRIDLITTQWFYQPDKGFVLGDAFLFAALHKIATTGARVLGLALLAAVLIALYRRKPVLGLGAKGWLFLLLGLLLGPGLIANGVLKDQWGRARPREIVEFGGAMHFSPPLIPAHECQHNCSFVSGDGSFGFYLPAIAYVVPRSKSRRVFWGGMAFGSLFAFSRIASGAHFLSDSLYAAFFMQAVLALLHAVLFGARETKKCWRDWLFLSNRSKS